MDENIPLNEHVIPQIEMLVDEFNARKRAYDESHRRLDNACVRAVIVAGLKVEEFEVNWDLKAFTPRKK